MKLSIGMKLGRLKIRAAPVNGYVRCDCDCGVTKMIYVSGIRRGTTKSCGCLYMKRRGEAKGKLYRAWHSMIRKCEVKSCQSYPRWGALGITVCERWHDYDSFVEDCPRLPYEFGYSLILIDDKLGFKPGNVRWAHRRSSRVKTMRRRRRETKSPPNFHGRGSSNL